MRYRILIPIMVIVAASMQVVGQPLVIEDTWQGHKVKILANVLRVRLKAQVAYTVEQAAKVMPAGLRVRSQLLAPRHTALFGTGLLRPPGATITDPVLRAEEPLVRTFIVEFDGPIDPRRLASKLMSGYDVIDVAEPWYLDQLQGTTNDPLINEQGYLRLIKAIDAWDVFSGDQAMVIAVADGGVDQSHVDLTDNIYVRPTEIPDNGVDDDDNGYVDDARGCNLTWEIDGDPGNTYNSDSHGTEVAGILGATWNNATGIAGISGRCRFFPLKLAVSGSNVAAFGYHAILYAAYNGFKVVNCSWGVVKPFSIIDQSVIDVATARGTLVVASAGNHGARAGQTPYDRNYPSAYRGVLGVGETTSLDRVTSTSGLGENADVLAPGYEAYTTTLGNTYTSFLVTGTSFAAPMASATAALVRAKYPQLTVAQTLALIRRSADDVTAENMSIARGLPGRLNVFRAVSEGPFTAPGIEIESYQLRSASGEPLARIPYDTPLRLALTLVDQLGPTTGMIASVRVVSTNDWDVTFHDSETEAVDLASGQRIVIDDLTLTIRKEGERPLVLAVRFLDEGTYDSERIIMIDRQSNMTIMENEVLAYSIGDQGALGVYGDPSNRLGIGFNWKPEFSMMSPSGLVVTESNARAVTGFNDIAVTSDFTSEKPFIAPDTAIGIMSDVNAPIDRRIGVRVRQRVVFPPAWAHANATVLDVTLTNTSGRTLTDVAAGYLLDWDLGSGGVYNRSRLAPEGIPESFAEIRAAAQVFYRTVPPVKAAVMCGVITSDLAARTQTAAFPYNDILGDGLSTQEMVDLLRSDAMIQTDQENDLAGLIGMRYPGAWEDGAQRQFLVVIVVAPTIDSAAITMQSVLLNPMSAPQEPSPQPMLIPNPASDAMALIHGLGVTRIDIYDMRGVVVHSADVRSDAERTTLQVDAIDVGPYVLSFTRGALRTTMPFVILR